MTFHILVIDDSRNVLKYYQRILQAEGYGVETTTFLTENWTEIERTQPDLIIFDLLVGAHQERKALHLAQQLQASALTSSIPILVCSAVLVLPSLSDFVRQKHISILSKPLHLNELTRKVRLMLLPPRE